MLSYNPIFDFLIKSKHLANTHKSKLILQNLKLTIFFVIKRLFILDYTILNVKNKLYVDMA